MPGSAKELHSGKAPSKHGWLLPKATSLESLPVNLPPLVGCATPKTTSDWLGDGEACSGG